MQAYLFSPGLSLMCSYNVVIIKPHSLDCCRCSVSSTQTAPQQRGFHISCLCSGPNPSMIVLASPSFRINLVSDSVEPQCICVHLTNGHGEHKENNNVVIISWNTYTGHFTSWTNANPNISLVPVQLNSHHLLLVVSGSVLQHASWFPLWTAFTSHQFFMLCFRLKWQHESPVNICFSIIYCTDIKPHLCFPVGLVLHFWWEKTGQCHGMNCSRASSVSSTTWWSVEHSHR